MKMRHVLIAAFIFSCVIFVILGMPSNESRSGGKKSKRDPLCRSPSKGKKSEKNYLSGGSSKQKISKGKSYLENCDTNADCPEISVCITPGFGKASAKSQGKCLYCNCSDSSQCTLEDGIMTCNCTGSGYTGLYCETPLLAETDCNCTNSSQCTLEDGLMTCNCTGSGYTGLYCETRLLAELDCNCTDSSQCTLEDGLMTCNCTGSGYTGLYCETYIDPCKESEVCEDFVTTTNSIIATTTPQIITSPDYPNEWYCDGLALTWVINAPAGKRIQITFTYFVTEYGADNVYIYEGNCTDPLSTCDEIAGLSGNADPSWTCVSYEVPNQPIINAPFVTSSNKATITFGTDFCCDTAPGWRASIIYID